MRLVVITDGTDPQEHEMTQHQMPQHQMAQHQMAPEHVGQVWHTNKMMNLPAILRLTNGRLSLTVNQGVVFDERLADIERIHVPWWWFSGGMVVTVRGRKQKIAFIQPNGAPSHTLDVHSALNGASLAAGVGALLGGGASFWEAGRMTRGISATLAIAPGRRACKTWRALLGV